MFTLLNDIKLHEHIGGEPYANIKEFLERYQRLSKGGSPDGRERWINWIIIDDAKCVGFVQATIACDSASIAWVIGTAYQSKGYATKAAKLLIKYLMDLGISEINANIGVGNLASQRVASKIGMRRTSVYNGDEQVWKYQSTNTTQQVSTSNRTSQGR